MGLNTNHTVRTQSKSGAYPLSYVEHVTTKQSNTCIDLDSETKQDQTRFVLSLKIPKQDETRRLFNCKESFVLIYTHYCPLFIEIETVALSSLLQM